MTVSLPRDAEGRLARQCPNPRCSPGCFKVRLGTGVKGEQTVCYCPYCRTSAGPVAFATKQQTRYVHDIARRELHHGFQRMIKEAFGLGPSGTRTVRTGLLSIETRFKATAPPTVLRPFEEDVRRDVVCPHCGLDHTVFGLARWCPDCGADIFLSHVAAELDIISRMASDVDQRRELLGRRIASKTLENCLEDAVSTFEAAMRAIVRYALLLRGMTPEQAEKRLQQLGNTFQSVDRTRNELAAPPLDYVAPQDDDWTLLSATFQRRHSIAHNLGVVDRKYLERTHTAEREGREIRVTTAEIEALLLAVRRVAEEVYRALGTGTASP